MSSSFLSTTSGRFTKREWLATGALAFAKTRLQVHKCLVFEMFSLFFL